MTKIPERNGPLDSQSRFTLIKCHISDHDLERYHLGMITDEAELAPLEEHLLGCPECTVQAEQCGSYVDVIRQAIILCGYDRSAATQEEMWASSRLIEPSSF